MLVARKWPQYVHHWENAEQKLSELQVMQYQASKVKQRIRRVLLFVVFVAFSKFVYVDKSWFAGIKTWFW
jgi:Trehalose receptor